MRSKPHSDSSNSVQTQASARFTAAISHELRTPLNGILGMASLLQETTLDPAQQDYVEAIRKSGNRLLELLNNVLDYSRLESGHLPLDQAPFDPCETIQEVAELLSPLAHTARLDIAALSPLESHYYGDVGRIRQILFNLVGNAVKFTDEGAVLIEAVSGPDNHVRFSVRDTGSGIAENARETLFEAFTQIHATDSDKGSGVGLGLAIVARLCTAMGGKISIESTPGYGACFHVDLPLRPAISESASPRQEAGFGTQKTLFIDTPAATRLAIMTALADSGMILSDQPDHETIDLAILDAALPPARIQDIAARMPCLVVLRPEDRSQLQSFGTLGAKGYLIRPVRQATLIDRVQLALAGETRQKTDETKRTPSACGQHVLIADDNAVNALLARRALEATGYEVDTVSTGAEAVEAACRKNYAVIFMDMRMPIMDGLEATRQIRALPGSTGQTPIIAVSADCDPSLQTHALEAGVDRLASKPIDPERLRTLAHSAQTESLAS